MVGRKLVGRTLARRQGEFFGALAVMALFMSPALGADDGPPVSGSVQNFIVFDEPVPAPQVAFGLEDGSEATFSAFGDRVTLVNFWATWCGPCIRELPSLQALHEELGGETFAVALFSQDREGWERVNPFLRKLKISEPESYLDSKLKLAQAMGVRGLPVTALMDGEGNIVGQVSGPAEWDTEEALALVQYYIDADEERRAGS